MVKDNQKQRVLSRSATTFQHCCCLHEEAEHPNRTLQAGRDSSSSATRPSQRNRPWTSVSSLKGKNLHQRSEGVVVKVLPLFFCPPRLSSR